ncbi:Transmembrane domain-containing protein [Spironucleus salmonicida]|uniref:Transmembrane domain-containing protein n=1 Tax=Spironucleus salmonicida TaxID=348837 RepID=A0A9P8RZF2_9EUKA|nr:Transmembrane domain-containing protein [Spironucleus salmonicida]
MESGITFLAFFKFSCKQWYLWTFIILNSVLTLFIAKENHTSPDSTRLGYLLKLNSIYYLSLLISVLFVPILFQGDGRFYTFLLGSNALFILFFISLLNPFYLVSTHFPQLENMSNNKLFFFSLFELTAYLTMALLHILWGRYLVQVNKFNIWYISQNQGQFQITCAYFTAVCLIPSFQLVFNGFLQLLIRLIKIYQDKALYQGENSASFRESYQEYKRLLKQQKREQKLLEERQRNRNQLNFESY